MPVATQYTLLLENRPGTLAEVCSELAAKAVNIQAIMTSDVRGWGAVRVVVNHPETARKVFEAMGVRFTEEEVLAVRLSDRPGALGRVTRKLAEHKINIDYVYGSIEKGSPKALVIMAVSDLESAAKLLK
ncbi:MAG TPA: ACT domain-containing protein [Candidatus Acidoferrales bacterium]|nr:ACT domain-containing protein [Candidatus Acidoferrales bacterium]